MHVFSTSVPSQTHKSYAHLSNIGGRTDGATQRRTTLHTSYHNQISTV